MAKTSSATPKCPYCGDASNHMGTKCGLVKAYEYHPDGTVKRVEFMTPADYIQTPIFTVPPPPPINPTWSITMGGVGDVDAAGIPIRRS